MANHPLRVLIAGGGTGGHVIPALAVARELVERHGAQVRFVGTARGLEVDSPRNLTRSIILTEV